MRFCGRLICVVTTALVPVLFVGCGDGGGKVVEPNKPPLSAEAAKEKAKKQQEARIEGLKLQVKQGAGE